MKKIILTVATFLAFTASTFAQSPDAFKYQAVIRDASSNIIANQAVGMQMTILQGSATGTAVYQETFAPTTNGYGLVNLEIGSGTVVSGNITTIDWSAGPYFIETALDASGGTNYSVMGTSQLLSVPYALYAKNAGNTFSGNYNDLTNQPVIPTNVSSLTNDAGYITSPNDADSDPTNEIQSLSFNLDTLKLSNGGNVYLGGYTSLWDTLAGNIYSTNLGNVGIGVSTPKSKFQIADNVATGGLDLFSEYQIILFQGSTGNVTFGFGIRTNTLVYNSASLHDFDVNGVTALEIDANGIVEEPWQNLTLQSGWSNLGGGYRTAQYYKDKEGVVHVKGIITGGSTPFNSVLFNLPAGYRPAERTMVMVLNSDPSNPGGASARRVDIGQGGDFVIKDNAVDAGFLSFEFSFRP